MENKPALVEDNNYINNIYQTELADFENSGVTPLKFALISDIHIDY